MKRKAKVRPVVPERFWVVLALKRYLYTSSGSGEIGCLPVFTTREAAEKAWPNFAIHCIEQTIVPVERKRGGK